MQQIPNIENMSYQQYRRHIEKLSYEKKKLTKCIKDKKEVQKKIYDLRKQYTDLLKKEQQQLQLLMELIPDWTG